MTQIDKSSGREVFFNQDNIIVSKTDLKGRLTYVNQTFCEISGFTEGELIGQPHSLIRHPEMPRAVFKLLWDTILDGREVFAYVKNLTKDGNYYWVFAHVTPSFDRNKSVVGFHSNRRVPDRRIVEAEIVPLYARILEEEQRHRNGRAALAAGSDLVLNLLKSRKVSYDELVFSL